MKVEYNTYFKGIEKKIIEEINQATKSIKIAMAWFTSNEIKDSLIELKKIKPTVEIEIVVDNNEINEKYFLDYKAIFEAYRIVIKEKTVKEFLHLKFMIIDDFVTLSGSYNFTNKARKNQEYIHICKSKKVSSHYTRIFNFVTTRNYIDENIRLLFEYPEFARKIISTYYPFDKSEYLKYKNKIEYGYCDTFYNGVSDQIQYEPGLIFNPKIKYSKETESEFSLPINKDFVKKWIEGRNEELIIDSYCQNKLFHLINQEIKKNKKRIEVGFKRKIENIFSYECLKEKIEGNINIILEDEIWSNNFEPFINKHLIVEVFKNIDNKK